MWQLLLAYSLAFVVANYVETMNAKKEAVTSKLQQKRPVRDPTLMRNDRGNHMAHFTDALTPTQLQKVFKISPFARESTHGPHISSSHPYLQPETGYNTFRLGLVPAKYSFSNFLH